jgi:DNA-3-methyladenine glycosylase
VVNRRARPSGRIDRADLGADAVHVAAGLLGARVVQETRQGLVAVRLTEVEAYAGPRDPGSHAYRGPTPRSRIMFGPAGFLYVYFSYGMHWCANVVCGPDGEASAVLLRAGEVVDGVELARSRRPAARTDAELARGPARLAAALGLGREHDGTDLCAPGSPVWLEPGLPGRPGLLPPVSVGPRVGVAGAGGDGAAYPWRFWLVGEATVSAYRPGISRRPRPVDDGKVIDGRLSPGTTTGAGRRPERERNARP